MAGLTLAQLETRLAAYLAAEAKILTSQEYRIGDRANKRAALEWIQAGIKECQTQIRELDPSQGRPRVGFAVPG